MARIRGYAKSDTGSIEASVGFQPRYLYVGATGGALVVVPRSDPTNPFTVNVAPGVKLPARDILRINSTNTVATGFIVTDGD